MPEIRIVDEGIWGVARSKVLSKSIDDFNNPIRLQMQTDPIHLAAEHTGDR